MTHFSSTEKNEKKRAGGKEGKKRGGKERRKEGKKKGRKERRQKKEYKCVFRHFQFCVVDYPHTSTNLDQGQRKK